MSQYPPQELNQQPINQEPGAPRQWTRQELERIFRQQRMLIFCFLTRFIIGMVIVAAAMAIAPTQPLTLPITLHLLTSSPLLVPIYFVYLILATIQVAFVIILAISLYNTGMAIVLGMMSFVPWVDIIVLLIVNRRATNVLRQHGMAVGLLGANPALRARQIQESYQRRSDADSGRDVKGLPITPGAWVQHIGNLKETGQVTAAKDNFIIVSVPDRTAPNGFSTQSWMAFDVKLIPNPTAKLQDSN